MSVGTDGCCFCCDLRQGTLVTVMISIITHVIQLLVAIMLFLVDARDITTVIANSRDVGIFFSFMLCAIVTYALNLTVDLLLMIGACRNVAWMFIPWLVWTTITVVVAVAGEVGVLIRAIIIYHQQGVIKDSLIPVGIAGLALCIIFCYLILVVFSQYKKLQMTSQQHKCRMAAARAQMMASVPAVLAPMQDTASATNIDTSMQDAASAPNHV